MSQNDQPQHPDRRFGEHARRETQKKHRDRVRETVRVALSKCHQKIQEGDEATSGLIASEKLLDTLEISRTTLPVYNEHLAKSRLPWHQSCIDRFMSSPAKYIAAAATPESERDAVEVLTTKAAGRRPPKETGERVIRRAVETMESIAVLKGFISASLSRSVPVTGFSFELGRWYQTYDMETESPYPIAQPDKHGSFSVAIGAKGTGKSTDLISLSLDRYAAGDKIIDIHDQEYLENSSQDIPQQQAELRRIREEMNLPAGLDEMDLDPDVEILVPLTEDLQQTGALYDTDAEEFTMRPVAVAASDLPPTVIKTLIGGISGASEDVLDEAFSRVSGDYSLKDVVAECLRVDEKDDIKMRAVRKLRNLQQDGWIRDHECEHVIDWDRIFRETNVITAFSATTLNGDESKMRWMYYLLRSVFRERAGDHEDYPRAVAVAREVDHLAPTQRNRREAVEDIQKQIVSEMQFFTSEQRHVDMEFIADTQYWGQVQRQVRRQVDQVYLHRVGGAAAQRVFEDTLGDSMDEYSNKVNQQSAGEATIIGPEWVGDGDDGIDFVRPVQMAPPPAHVIDPDKGPGNGWAARTRYLSEEIRDPPEEWQCTLPPRLRFDADGAAGTSGNASTSDDADAPEVVVEFVAQCVTAGDSERCAKEDVRSALKGYAAERDALDALPDGDDELGRVFTEALAEDVETGLTKKSNDRTNQRRKAYIGIGLSGRGETMRQEWESVVRVGAEDDVTALDTIDVLEAIYAAEIRSSGDEEWVPVEDDDQDRVTLESEVRRRLGDLGTVEDFARVVEQLGTDDVEQERHSGEVVVRLTPAARSTVVTHDSGGLNGGMSGHRHLARRTFEVLTQLGLVVAVPDQDGSEMPDAVADLPVDTEFDVSDVDGVPEDAAVGDLSAEDMQRVAEAREEHQREILETLREYHPNLAAVADGDAYVEVESGTAGSWQTLKNLKKAVNAGKQCIFVTKEDQERFEKYAEKIERVCADGFVSERCDGDRKLYTQARGKRYRIRVNDGIAVRRKDRRPSWWDRSDRDELTYETSDGDIIGTLTPGDVERGRVDPEQGFAWFVEDDEEYSVRRVKDGEVTEVARYASEDAMDEEWAWLSPPFHPESEFREVPDASEWTTIIVPDDDSEDFEEPQVYCDGDLVPLFSGSVHEE